MSDPAHDAEYRCCSVPMQLQHFEFGDKQLPAFWACLECGVVRAYWPRAESQLRAFGEAAMKDWQREWTESR